MVGFGSQVSASCVIRAHVIQSSWLRRRSVRWSVTCEVRHPLHNSE
jgi:hypothetical protein